MKKLQNLLDELRNLDPISDYIYISNEVWNKISILDKKYKEKIVGVLKKLGMENDASCVDTGPVWLAANFFARTNKNAPSFCGSEYLNKAEEFYNFLIDTVKTN